MFTITNTRIVGLIAVVCAIIAAPQALAAPSIHSRIAPPGDEPSGRAVFTAATPDAVQGNDLSGFDLGDLKNGRARVHGSNAQKRQGGDVRLRADQPRLGRGSDRGEEVRVQARGEDRTCGLQRPARVRVRLLGMCRVS